jgi:glycosyltransferase involved in cell wall biosynthesis
LQEIIPLENTSYTPLVSVIIPTYNRADFIIEAINSVLNQTYKHFEIIVVDDGSNDNTVQVLAPYQDRITLITQKNGGISVARNTGIAASKGELVAFLDDDDRWLPHKLAVQAPLFADPKVKLVHTAGHFFDESNGWENTQFFGDVDFHDLLGMKIIYVQTVITRRSVLDEVGLFDETLPAAEDVDMWLRIASKYPMTGIDNCTAEMRCTATSMQNNSNRVFTYLNLVLEKHSHHHGDCELCRSSLAKSRHQLRIHFYEQCKKKSRSALDQKLYGQAIKLRLQAFRYDPMALPKLPYSGVKYIIRKLTR